MNIQLSISKSRNYPIIVFFILKYIFGITIQTYVCIFIPFYSLLIPIQIHDC